jgi:hypothetical protein
VEEASTETLAAVSMAAAVEDSMVAAVEDSMVAADMVAAATGNTFESENNSGCQINSDSRIILSNDRSLDTCCQFKI